MEGYSWLLSTICLMHVGNQALYLTLRIRIDILMQVSPPFFKRFGPGSHGQLETNLAQGTSKG